MGSRVMHAIIAYKDFISCMLINCFLTIGRFNAFPKRVRPGFTPLRLIGKAYTALYCG